MYSILTYTVNTYSFIKLNPFWKWDKCIYKCSYIIVMYA